MMSALLRAETRTTWGSHITKGSKRPLAANKEVCELLATLAQLNCNIGTQAKR